MVGATTAGVWCDVDADALVVMELELIEPSFYFESSAGSATRFGAALVDALGLDGRGAVS